MKWHYLILLLLCTANLQAMEKEKEDDSENNFLAQLTPLILENERSSKQALKRGILLGKVSKIVGVLIEIEKEMADKAQNSGQELLKILTNRTLEDQTEGLEALKKEKTHKKELQRQCKEHLIFMKEATEEIENYLDDSDEDDQAEIIPGLIYNPVIDV